MKNVNATLNVIHDDIMKYASLWVKCSTSRVIDGWAERYWGMAAGLVHAHLYLTDNEEAYNEYYAMLGVG